MSKSTGRDATSPDVFAAGGIVSRSVDGASMVAVVVRHRYGGDVSFPKGKPARGESLRACARREVEEELGADVDVGSFVGAITYPVAGRDKYVLMWEMTYRGEREHGPDADEVAEVRWLAPLEAQQVLSYDGDRELLTAWLSRRRS